jgi:hypothetical protein
MCRVKMCRVYNADSLRRERDPEPQEANKELNREKEVAR